MSQYYNKEKVQTGNFARVYPSNNTHPTFSYRLVGVFDNGLYEYAVDLSKKSEWNHFYIEQYCQGYLLRAKLYDVPHTADIDM